MSLLYKIKPLNSVRTASLQTKKEKLSELQFSFFLSGAWDGLPIRVDHVCSPYAKRIGFQLLNIADQIL